MKTKYRLHAILLLGIIGLIIGSFQNYSKPTSNIDNRYLATPQNSALTTHNPIHISGDSALNAFCAGNGTDGTATNPHIIQNFEIDAGESGNGIFIEDTDLFVIISDCKLINSGFQDTDSGIHLDSVQNLVIKDNIFDDNRNGIYLTSTSQVNITNNSIDNSHDNGIKLISADYITMENNTIVHTDYAIYADRSEYGKVSNSTLSGSEYSLELWIDSDHWLVQDNYISGRGIFIVSSKFNNFSRNIFENIGGDGVTLQSSSNNIFNRSFMTSLSGSGYYAYYGSTNNKIESNYIDSIGGYGYYEQDFGPSCDFTSIIDSIIVKSQRSISFCSNYNTIDNCTFSGGWYSNIDLRGSEFNSITNIAPEAKNCKITLEKPKTSDDLNITYTYVTYHSLSEQETEIIWYKDGIIQPLFENETSIPASETSQGERWNASVRAFDGNKFGYLEHTNTVEIVSVPNAPIMVTINQTINTTGEFVLKWLGVQDATSYNVYVNETFYISTTEIELTIDIQNNGVYIFHVTSFGDNGESINSKFIKIVVELTIVDTTDDSTDDGTDDGTTDDTDDDTDDGTDSSNLDIPGYSFQLVSISMIFGIFMMILRNKKQKSMINQP